MGYDDDLNLYAYTRNDPLNGIDASGLYTCGSGNNLWDIVTGVSDECARVDQFISTARESLNNLDPESDDYRKIESALNYLGARNERTGIEIQPVNFSRDSRMADADPTGLIRIDVDNIDRIATGYGEQNASFSNRHLGDVFGGAVLMHEARHVRDFDDYGPFTNAQESMRTELNGYATQRAVLRAFGMSTRLWEPHMTSQEQSEALYRAALGSCRGNYCR